MNNYTSHQLNMNLLMFSMYPEIESFLKEHDIDLDVKEDMLYNVINILNVLGYSIEVTEISTAVSNNVAINGHCWKRLNMYRWTICFWDKNGMNISIRHSDYVHRNEMPSEIDAYKDAINYIVNNYKELEGK